MKDFSTKETDTKETDTKETDTKENKKKNSAKKDSYSKDFTVNDHYMKDFYKDQADLIDSGDDYFKHRVKVIDNALKLAQDGYEAQIKERTNAQKQRIELAFRSWKKNKSVNIVPTIQEEEEYAIKIIRNKEVLRDLEREKCKLHSDYDGSQRMVNDGLKKLKKLDEYKNASEEIQKGAETFLTEFHFRIVQHPHFVSPRAAKDAMVIKVVDPEYLALAYAMARSIGMPEDHRNVTHDTYRLRIRNFVNDFNIDFQKKYIIMGYLGYINVKGRFWVKRYIRRLYGKQSFEGMQLMMLAGYPRV